MEKKRSKGVTVFAWFELILGIWIIFQFSGLTSLYMSNGNSMEQLAYCITHHGEQPIFGTILIVAGILTLQLRPTGRILSILGFPLIFVFEVWKKIAYYREDFSSAFLGGIAIGFIIVSIPVYFFTRPKVKEQFKKQSLLA